MCGRFTLIDWDAIERRFLLAGLDTDLISEHHIESGFGWGVPRFNIAPTQEVLTVTNAGGQNHGQFMRWGLVPSWAKDISVGNRMINARSETLAERPSFRVAFRRRRCLVIADSFYEWKRDGGKRIPMRISIESGGPFAFAGLWETWKRPDEGTVLSCTIITTAANEFMEPIHDRMPVILDPDAESVWLDPDLQDADILSELLGQYPSDQMTAYEVSTVVNSPGNDVPECIEPVNRMF